MTTKVFHYTNLEAVESILNNQSIWMTSHYFLNDRQEFLEGFNRIGQIVIDYINVNKQTLSKFQIDAFHKTINDLKNTTLLIASFSKNGDLLSQWRSYGNFSIEFDINILLKSIQNTNRQICLIRECLYDNKEKDRQAKLIGETYLSVLPHIPSKMDIYNLYIGYIEYIVRAKNEHFFEEQEIRVITQMHKENKEIIILDELEIDGSGKNGTILCQGPINLFSKLNIQERNNKIQYLDQKININSIKSITISPQINFEINKIKLEQIFSRLNLNIEIKKSKIPYRV